MNDENGGRGFLNGVLMGAIAAGCCLIGLAALKDSGIKWTASGGHWEIVPTAGYPVALAIQKHGTHAWMVSPRGLQYLGEMKPPDTHRDRRWGDKRQHATNEAPPWESVAPTNEMMPWEEAAREQPTR